MPSHARILLMLRDRVTAGGGKLLQGIVRRKPELLEPRYVLDATPIEFGAVYVEQDLGSDANPDAIEVSFVGGAAGTQLSRVEINGDKFDRGLSLGDILFDTQTSGLGADLAFAGLVTDRVGQFSEQILVEDGGSTIVLLLEDFQAGDRLTLSIDADEVQGFDPNVDRCHDDQ